MSTVSLPAVQQPQQVLVAEPTPSPRYVSRGSREFIRPPISFTIKLSPHHYRNQQAVCYPGAVLEGVVSVTLKEPLAAQHLKLVFKAAEKLNYDTLGWDSSKPEGRLFGVRTLLWGTSPEVTGPMSSLWTVMEAGQHSFPFVCELPLVNYPPSFSHHLVACTFSLIGSIERPGERPFQTAPLNLQYHPILETCPLKVPKPYNQEIKLSHSLTARVSLVNTSFNILEIEKIPIEISFCGQTDPTKLTPAITHVELALKRFMKISRGPFYRNEAVLISRVERRLADKDNLYLLQFNVPLISDNTNLKTTATLNYSHHLSLSYQISVSIKVRHGPFMTTKRLLCVIPITLGTLPAGGRTPSDMMVFTESRVVHDTTLLTKPKFMRPIEYSPEHQLPAYDSHRPPSYHIHVQNE
ncbi:hypothetical protein J3Q64DRAFT_1664294 [Phycomyces blakesleeanus]|uniref:Arrestin-like N-terminal domain-containing protein n=2 Tax=Phycomyces blakesleeanus TaxID=4837 RepID=A0A162NDJ9_PHYB8|nr:hypothetical protein PHYBLDRAFT_150676 [Phycomyces blakesleeanus NRRL 1555(-)]OAD68504.1 hypothetical protein PHYBLDRAFT_150676 [Phycomyces blakesleeanus NRRL 1555(-)]|eukprot:XP_018286544.1 hypothetical protein PHYBLDRAFT_150676 [Phycomyces blakesleeanus NRRL 1555(-)]